MVTDSRSCVQTFEKLCFENGLISLEDPNADVWQCLWQVLLARPGGVQSFSLRWVKAQCVADGPPLLEKWWRKRAQPS